MTMRVMTLLMCTLRRAGGFDKRLCLLCPLARSTGGTMVMEPNTAVDGQGFVTRLLDNPALSGYARMTLSH